jgi:heavy metal translocating P-type ATPase
MARLRWLFEHLIYFLSCSYYILNLVRYTLDSLQRPALQRNGNCIFRSRCLLCSVHGVCAVSDGCSSAHASVVCGSDGSYPGPDGSAWDLPAFRLTGDSIEESRHDMKTSIPPSRPMAQFSPTETLPPSPSSRSVKMEHLATIVHSYPIPIIAVVLMVTSLILRIAGAMQLSHWSLIAVILLGGIPLLWETVVQLWHREVGVDLIAIIAILGTLLLGEYLAGAIVVLMLSGGKALEVFALNRARRSLSLLADRAPRIAHIWQDDTLIDISAEVVDVGMDIVVKPGEVIPVDGLILSGTSSVSEADLTGEPVPVNKYPGVAVMSGSVNLDGVIEIRALRRSAESKYAQILQLVQEAQTNKAPIHRLADQYSVGFTVAALGLAALAWIISANSLNALAVLVVATPCPLILATPIAIMSGIGSAARNGVILKSGAAMEQLGEIDVALFDKTGTLTLGAPQMTNLILDVNSPFTTEQALRLAASVEQVSSHILSRAIVEAAQERHLDLTLVRDFSEIPGKGVSGLVHLSLYEPEHIVAIGNRTFMEHLAIVIPTGIQEERAQRVGQGEIVSYLAIDNAIVGLIVMADIIRSDVASMVETIKKAGISETVLLTGDNETVAHKVGEIAHIDHVIARCLPDDKVRAIRAYLDRRHKVLMVGDGVNDAPALATATVGMAIGAQGMTAASATADAVLLSTDIRRVAISVQIGRWVMFVARQGIWLGMGLSGLAMIVAAFGYLPPAVGALLQEGIDVLVILNALRAGQTPRP